MLLRTFDGLGLVPVDGSAFMLELSDAAGYYGPPYARVYAARGWTSGEDAYPDEFDLYRGTDEGARAYFVWLVAQLADRVGPRYHGTTDDRPPVDPTPDSMTFAVGKLTTF